MVNIIYIVNDGTISYEHNDRISDIILTRSVGNKMVEVLAWVKEPKQLIKIKENRTRKSDNNRLCEEQEKYLKDICYDVNHNITVDKIFDKNTYRGKKEENVIYATFEANEVVKPNKTIFLTCDEENTKYYPNTYYINKKITNQSQRTYIRNDEEIVKKLLYNNELWEKKDTFEKVDIDKYIKKENFNFLKIIKHEYFEPAFSNLFQYYFLKNKEVFEKFSKLVLKVDINVNDEDFEIKREEHDIDLLVRDSKNIIVIENKVKSGINGIKYDVYGEKIQTQLEKYANYANCSKEDNSKEKDNPDHPHYHDKDRKSHFFIFAPNYKHIETDKFVKAKNYTTITYKQIYEFYKNEKEKFDDDKYFEDFLSALEKHTKEVDSETYDIMLERLVTRIREISNKRNK